MEIPRGGHWRNWVGNQSFVASHMAAPSSEEELAALMKEATGQGLSVRCSGSGHSFTPIVATSGMLLSLKDYQGVLHVDRGGEPGDRCRRHENQRDYSAPKAGRTLVE